MQKSFASNLLNFRGVLVLSVIAYFLVAVLISAESGTSNPNSSYPCVGYYDVVPENAKILEDGYCYQEGNNQIWVHGLPTWETSHDTSINRWKGDVTIYNPGVMEMQLERYGVDLSESQYLDGVALPVCGFAGQTVWLRRPGHSWEGPYLAADCAAQVHMYLFVERGFGAEVGFSTGLRWGMVEESEDGNITRHSYNMQDVEVAIGPSPPEGGQTREFREHWRSNARFEKDGVWYTYSEITQMNPKPFSLRSEG